MQSDDRGQNGNDPGFTYGIDAARQRRNGRQEYSQVEDQCCEPADRADKVKVVDPQNPKDHDKYDAVQQAKKNVGNNVAANHRRNVRYRTVGQQAVFFGEKSHGCYVEMILGHQHEINQKRYEPNRHQYIHDGAAIFGYELGQSRWLLDLDGDGLLGRLGRFNRRACAGFNPIGFGTDLSYQFANLGRIGGQLIRKFNRAIIKEK